MSKNFDDLLNELRDDRTSLTSDMLSEISDMSSARREAFEKIWPQVSVTRRREIVEALVEMAESNIEFDFNPIFRLSLEDEDAEIRARSIQGLWEDEDYGLVGPLLHMLRHDQEERVREQATESLGRFLLLGELGFKEPAEFLCDLPDLVLLDGADFGSEIGDSDSLHNDAFEVLVDDVHDPRRFLHRFDKICAKFVSSFARQ